MKWFLAKLVYRIICGAGQHTPQFDEQLRLIQAPDKDEAFEKAYTIGTNEEETFYNKQAQLVQWKFVNVSELHYLTELIDGAEVYSKINEVDDAAAYTAMIHTRAEHIQETFSHPLLNPA
jgi:hypothetical protein